MDEREEMSGIDATTPTTLDCSPPDCEWNQSEITLLATIGEACQKTMESQTLPWIVNRTPPARAVVAWKEVETPDGVPVDTLDGAGDTRRAVCERDFRRDLA